MKKILFVSSEYYPQPSPNGICAEKIVRCCRKRGYDVIYLGVTNYKNLPQHELIDGVPVYRVKSSLYNRIVCNWHNLPKWCGLLLFTLSKIYMCIKKCLAVGYWPLNDFALCKHTFQRICDLHRKYQFDCIVATHGPISAMAALHDFAEREKGTRCIYYYIDALSAGNAVRINQERFAGLPIKNLFFKIAKKWELCFAQHADRIVVTEATKSHYLEHFADADMLKKMVFLNIPLLEESSESLQGQIKSNQLVNELFLDGKKVVLFCGRLYSLRDPTYILNVIEKLSRNDVQWVFLGKYDLDCEKKLLLAQHKFPNRIKVCGSVSHDLLIPCLDRADFFLNIGERLSSVVAGKVFEYISWGKPIISTFPISNNSSIPVLKKYPNSLLLNENDEINNDLLRTVDQFLDGNYGKRVAFADMKKVLYSSTPDAFVDVIDMVLAEDD